MADASSNPLQQPLPDGTIPERVVVWTERRWIAIMAGMLIVMMAVIVVTGVTHALHPPSNVEVIDPQTLHLNGEFVESNLGTTLEPDGSITVRIIALQFDFVPHCVRVPADTPVRPGFVSEVRTRFSQPGEYEMPCHEFCGLGHHGMVTHVSVVAKDSFPTQGLFDRTTCAQE